MEIDCDSENEGDFHTRDADMQKKLRNIFVRHGCTRQCMNKILKLLNENGHDFPNDSRTLLRTRRAIEIKEMSEGYYIYFGVKGSLVNKFKTNCYKERLIKLKINIDGLPLFKSSNFQLWPTLIQFANYRPITIALYGGKKKPSINMLMILLRK